MDHTPSSAAQFKEESLTVLPAYHQPDRDKNNPFASDIQSVHSSTVDYEKQLVAPEEDEEITNTISKWKLILRLFQLLCVIGSFGFQASANTWSNRTSIPFDSVALLFFFYVAEWFAFIWSAFCIYVCLSVRFNSRNAGNIKPAVGFAMDTILAVILGIAICMEIGTYSCPAGGFNGWCNFYNVGLGFGMMLFLSFSFGSLWDLFSGLSCLRTKPPATSHLV